MPGEKDALYFGYRANKYGDKAGLICLGFFSFTSCQEITIAYRPGIPNFNP